MNPIFEFWLPGGVGDDILPIRVWPAPARKADGPVGLCWHNAREFAGQNPARYAYAEGLVSCRWPNAPDKPRWEPHGWVVDRRDDTVVETTTRYHDAAVRYRGTIFDVRVVNEFLDSSGRREEFRTVWPDGTVYAEPPGIVDVLLDELDDGKHKDAVAVALTLSLMPEEAE